MKKKIHKIVISRTDNIGDVLLTLPLAGYLKSHYPNIEIIFIGKAYTQPIIQLCKHVDQFIDRNKIIENNNLLRTLNADAILFIYPDKALSKIAYHNKIRYRIGTSHRFFHWFYCNQLVHFSRKRSSLHEAQLNFKLLQGLGIKTIPPLSELSSFYGWDKVQKKNEKDTFKLILHPKSKGSAREWPLKNYNTLVEKLDKKRFTVYLTGTREEGDFIRANFSSLFDHDHVKDMTGHFSLSELIAFIAQADGFLACSTGPLHIAAALGIPTLGIYPPLQPMHPGRWAPLGEKADYIVKNENCKHCPQAHLCTCLHDIKASEVLARMASWENWPT